MPYANRLTLHLMAAMAEHEREMISQRTKAALAAAKARGVKLGNPNGAAHLLAGCREAAEKARTARSISATQRAIALRPLIEILQIEGFSRPILIAVELNRRGIPAPAGGAWYPEQVRRVLNKLERDL